MSRVKRIIASVLTAVVLLTAAAPSVLAAGKSFDGNFVSSIHTFSDILASGKEAVWSLQIETENHRYSFVLGGQNGENTHLALEIYYDGDVRWLLGTEVSTEKETRYHWLAPVSPYVTALSMESLPRIAGALVLFLADLGMAEEEAAALSGSMNVESLKVDLKEESLSSCLKKIVSFYHTEDNSVFAGIPFAGETVVAAEEQECYEIRENFLPLLLQGIDKALFSEGSLFSHEELIDFIHGRIGRIPGKILLYGTEGFDDEGLENEMVSIRVPFISPKGEEFTVTVDFGEDGYLKGSGRLYFAVGREKDGEITRVLEVNCDNTEWEDSILTINLPEVVTTYEYNARKENVLPDGRTIVAEEGALRQVPGIVDDELTGRVVVVPDGEREDGTMDFTAYFYDDEESYIVAKAESRVIEKEPEILVNAEESDILYFDSMSPEEIADVLMDNYVGLILNTVGIFSGQDEFVYPEGTQLMEEEKAPDPAVII